MSEVCGGSSEIMSSNSDSKDEMVTSARNVVKEVDNMSHRSHDRSDVSTDDITNKDTSTKPLHAQQKTPLAMAPVVRVEADNGEECSVVFADDDFETLSLPNPVEAEVSPSISDRSDQESTTGKDANLPPYIEPDMETCYKIINQVEFYFSDANILKDAFLLKHVRRNKQGYVNIKLITSFKKVKSLTRDYRIVAYSLRYSQNLEVNEEGTKVRRCEPLPEYDETTPSRTVVIVDLPLENPTIENVAEIFKECGEISLVRILRPGKNIPGDIKKHSNKHPQIGITMCAVVEFEQHEFANKACNMSQLEGTMRVVLLAAKQPKKDKNKQTSKDRSNHKLSAAKNPSESGNENQRSELTKSLEDRTESERFGYHINTPNLKGPNPRINRPDDGKSDTETHIKVSEAKDIPGGRKRNRNKKRSKDISGDDVPYSSGSEIEISSSPSERDRNWRATLSPGKPVDRNRLSPASTPGSSPRGSPLSSPGQKRKQFPQKSPLASENSVLSPKQSPKPSPMSSPESSRRNRADSTEALSPGGSPWVQRRLKAAKEMSPLAAEGVSPSGSPLIQRKGLDDHGRIIRHPRGPDGTRGFNTPRSSLAVVDDSV